MNFAFKTLDAQVMTMLRARELTRYQIHELLGYRPATAIGESAVNKLLDSLWERELIVREGILYRLTARGIAALHLIDEARPAHRADVEQEALAAPAIEAPAAAPGVDEALMMRGRVRPTSGADLRPAPGRAGSRTFLEAPSRMGNTLHYRDGRITDMAGNTLSTRRTAHGQQDQA